MNISLPHSTGISCIFDHEDCTVNSWVSQIGAAQFEVHNPIIVQDYVAFVGSDNSYAKITYGGASGGNATNSNYCIRYVIFKNLSGVYANWKTIIGNETGSNYCSTIAMNNYSNIQFTRRDITTSYSCSVWHVVCWTSNKVSHTNTLWIDGIKVGTSSGCNGWGSDTYLAKGSSWGYLDNDTAFKCYIVGDSIPSDSDIVDNINYLRAIYGLKWYLNSSDELTYNELASEVAGSTFTPPYPASMWYLDENNKLLNALLPEPYEEKHNIVHDNPDGTEYFNYHSNAYDSALSNLNNNYRIRLEILTDEETVIGEITKDLSLTAAGQITINYEQITRRSCSLSLINVDNKYIPTKNSPFWLNRKFRLWLGLVVGKDTYWWSQGIFYTVSANATGRILSIEGIDKGGALDGTLKLNMTEAQYQFKRGKALTEMIKQTLALDVGNPYGANNSPIGFGGNRPIDSQPPLIGIEYYGFNTVADISIDANSYISGMFVNMAELYAADCYYNTNGNLVFEQHIDSSGYNYVPTQWSFTDLSSTFEDVNYEYSYEGENVVTVYTNTTEAGVRNVAWTAYNTNPLSPLNVATGIRRAPHIEIPYYHNDELSNEEQEAQQIKDCRSTANHYLLANSMLGMTLNFNAPIIPHMDVNKTIQISDKYADIEDGIYVVQSITIPLSSDKMQISATNINWLPNDMTFSGVSEIVESNNTQNGGAET